jgi:hypothetical protein
MKKIKPSRILMIVCGTGMLTAIILTILGVALKSPILQKTGAIFLLATAVISSLPLIFGSCYLFLEKMQKRRQKAENTEKKLK